MQILPVKSGIWRDYSYSSAIARDIVTLNALPAVYLIVAVSLFVGLVGCSGWSVLVSWWRLNHEVKYQHDVQHELEVVSPSSSVSSSWSPRTLVLSWQRSNHQMYNKTRSLISRLLTVLVFVSSTQAGLCLISLISGDRVSENVRVGSGQCGTFEFDTTSDGTKAAVHKSTHDTIAARSYVKQCYNSPGAAVPCSLYSVTSIKYSSSQTACPFGSDLYGNSLCTATAVPMVLDTGLLDSDHMFGVNARPENRILVRKTLTCSPLNTTAYTKVIHDSGFTELNLGPISGILNSTFLYDRNHADQAAYHVNTIAATPGSWSPTTPLRVNDGDLHLVIVSTNSVRYTAPVEDAWLRASTPIQVVPGEVRYRSDQEFASMGCIDRVQICNPNTLPHSCTVLGKWSDAAISSAFIGLNPFQHATASRLSNYFLSASTARTIVELGDQGLLASQYLTGIISRGLPQDQWQAEVEGWFATSLARIQAAVLDLVARRPQLERHGQMTAPNDRFTAFFCDNQRVRNTSDYQNFSLWGLALILCVGTPLIILSQVIEPSVRLVRRRLSAYQMIGDEKDVEVFGEKTGSPRITMAEASYDNTWETLLKESQVLRLGKRFAPRKSSSRSPCYTIIEEEPLMSEMEEDTKH